MVTIIRYYNCNLPGHFGFSHTSLEFGSPTQLAPDPTGAGAVHDLCLDLVPAPQLELQSLHKPQSDQPPSTSGTSKLYSTNNK